MTGRLLPSKNKYVCLKLSSLILLSCLVATGIVLGALFGAGVFKSHQQHSSESSEGTLDATFAYQDLSYYENLSNAYSDNGQFDVIVIGAGAAGLAATALLGSGAFTPRVLLLEASNRVGGRVLSSPFAGSSIELGSQGLLASALNPLYSLAMLASVSLANTDSHVLQKLMGITLDQCQPPDSIHIPGWADVQVFESICKGHPMDDDIAFGGLGHLTEFMLSQIKQMPNVDLIFNSTVENIALIESGGVQISTSNGQTYRSKYAISTIPVGVLQSGSVTFSPRLPLEIETIVLNMEIIVMNTIHLAFDSDFWPMGEEVFQISYDGEQLNILNVQSFTGDPIIVLFPTTRISMKMEEEDETYIIQSVLKALGEAFNITPPVPISHHITRWGLNPHARGSYTKLPPCLMGTGISILHQPIGGSLLLAGEAFASVHPGTLHGAFLSGLEQANRILEIQNASRHFLCDYDCGSTNLTNPDVMSSY